MDAADDFHDWELLLNPEKSATANPTSDSDDGAINSNYFSLDLQNPDPEPNQETPSPVGSENPSWIDPESSSQFLDRPPAPVFWSDESVDSQRSLLDGEIERGVDAESPKSVGSVKELASDGDGDGDGDGGEGKRVVWWKLPFEVVKVFVFKVKPVWSISVAVAMLGIIVLGRRIYRMKYKTRNLALKISLDGKKASQLKVQASRLNEASSIVKRAPIIRPSVPAGGLSPWPVLGFQ